MTNSKNIAPAVLQLATGAGSRETEQAEVNGGDAWLHLVKEYHVSCRCAAPRTESYTEILVGRVDTGKASGTPYPAESATGPVGEVWPCPRCAS
jgi:hypothetical protein